MVTAALTTFSVSLLVCATLFVVVRKERRLGRRSFAATFRGWLDRIVGRITTWLCTVWRHFMKYVVQLNWYYSIHSVLRTVLGVIVRIYNGIETLFEKNRARTKQLRAEKKKLSEYNHLQQMAVHRQDTALTPVQQRKLKQRTLEGKD